MPNHETTELPWMTWDKVVKELDGDDEISPMALDRMRGEITQWDCEEWPTRVGHALLNRLIRLGAVKKMSNPQS